MRRNLWCVFAVSVAAALWTGSASATTFVGTGTATDTIPFSPTGPAIWITGSPFNVNTGDLSLNATYNVSDLFDIWFNPFTAGNTGTDTVTVNFNFTLPPGGATGFLTATAVGHTVFGPAGYLEIDWDNPLTLDFGNGVGLQIDLGDLDKTKSCTGQGGDKQCTYTTVLNNPYDEWLVGDVGGTFTYVLLNTSLTTPLPATLPLFASGLGALGLLGWRKKRKQVVA
jgi:PEP-CTERM motif